jgi:hypothetical protein
VQTDCSTPIRRQERDTAVIRRLIDEDGRIVADITPEENLRLGQVPGCHPQEDPPVAAHEVHAREHQLHRSLFSDPQSAADLAPGTCAGATPLAPPQQPLIPASLRN